MAFSAMLLPATKKTFGSFVKKLKIIRFLYSSPDFGVWILQSSRVADMEYFVS